MLGDVRMRRVRAMVEAFFGLLNENGGSPSDMFPRDIERLIPYALEIPVIGHPNLTVHSAAEYLCILFGPEYEVKEASQDRKLGGLLHVGPRGTVIFVCDSLPARSRNYVLAHELGHLLSDVFLVMGLWVKALPEKTRLIRDFFAWRSNDAMLELSALVRGLPPRPRTIVGRDQVLTPETEEREILADLFARELLAPWEVVAPLFLPEGREAFIDLLYTRFSLPRKIGAHYYSELRSSLAPTQDLLDRLFAPIISPENTSS